MEYLVIAVVFGILMACFAFLDEKRREQAKDINALYDVISRQADRVSILQEDVRKLTEQVKITDQQEKRVLEGMGNILNYNLDIARKAASKHAGDEE